MQPTMTLVGALCVILVFSTTEPMRYRTAARAFACTCDRDWCLRAASYGRHRGDCGPRRAHSAHRCRHQLIVFVRLVAGFERSLRVFLRRIEGVSRSSGTARSRKLLFTFSRWPLNADARNGQTLLFFQNGYRCLALDRRRHGRSCQASAHNEMDGHADDPTAVIEAPRLSTRPYG